MCVSWPFLKNFSVFWVFFRPKATRIAHTGVLVTSHVSNPVYVVSIIYGQTDVNYEYLSRQEVATFHTWLCCSVLHKVEAKF